jgi:hypothetical protein
MNSLGNRLCPKSRLSILGLDSVVRLSDSTPEEPIDGAVISWRSVPVRLELDMFQV